MYQCRARLRKANAAHESVEDIIVTHFNLLLGDSNASTFFWHTFIKAQLSSKFGKYGQALTCTCGASVRVIAGTES
jgi:hypothetical protein